MGFFSASSSSSPCLPPPKKTYFGIKWATDKVNSTEPSSALILARGDLHIGYGERRHESIFRHQ